MIFVRKITYRFQNSRNRKTTAVGEIGRFQRTFVHQTAARDSTHRVQGRFRFENKTIKYILNTKPVGLSC